jgi:uncharacterized membrane protein YjjP (DUF1212 family)
VTSSFDQERKGTPAAPGHAVDVLLWFAVSMLRAGNTAFRTRERTEAMARKMGFAGVSVSLTLDNVTISVRRADEWVTAMRDVGLPGINIWRIGELERLAKTVGLEPSPREIAAELAQIESASPRYSRAQIAAAIGVASGGFAFLNGAGAPEMLAAAIGGGIGHWLRALLSRHQLNQYGVAALAAAAASGAYVLAAALAGHVGFAFARYPAGFISSVLFLVPGFPLIAGLFDLLQHQTVAAVSRLAHGVMTLLAVALGLSVVIAVAGVDLSRQPPLELAYPLKLLLRGAASFAAAGAFAILFNSTIRITLAVGLLALVANSLRLALHDAGMMLAPAAFLGALAIGVVALLVDQRFGLPRIAMAVPTIIVMIPGVYAFEMIVLFNRGQMLDALQASASCGFVIGALAMGLAAARLFGRR